MSSRAQTRAQAVTPPAARGLKKNRRDQPSRPQLHAVDEHDFARRAAEDAADDANRFDGSRVETQSRFGHDFSRLSVATSVPAPVPSQLFISQPQDAVEQQAKALARDAMTMPMPQPASESEADAPRQTLTASRHASSAAETDRRESIDADTQSRLQALLSGGQKLPPAVRDFFEPRLGFDFSRVRIHSDPSAAELASDLDARAFTLGQHIVFDRDVCGPETTAYRSVLAHELAHVTQQADPPQLAATQIHKDPAAQPTPAQTALAKALRGDDDDTRDLTKHSDWPGLDLTPDQATLLLIHLLDGATGDDDEKAGLKILGKMVAETRLDDTLEMLHTKKRFGQLFDDYDGSEYTDLLDLLANQITRRNVKMWMLDKFLSMWWVKEKEERAIVVLLEKAPIDDKTQLLTTGHRLTGLRKAIDTKSLSVRFERVVREVNVQYSNDLQNQLANIFTVKANQSVASQQRNQADVTKLLNAATAELATVLLEYRQSVDAALNDPHADPDKVAKLNDHFRQQLNEVTALKSREFGLELTYNLEFRRILENKYKPYAREWTRADLDAIDKILAQIPPEILYASPDFHTISRGAENSQFGGLTGADEMKLFGAFNKSAVAHEFGHAFHQAEPQLFADFLKISNWKELTKQDFIREIPDRKEREKFLKSLEVDPKASDFYKTQSYGNYYYTYNDFKKKYYRTDKKIAFFTDYAIASPNEDFATSFGAYIDEPQNLRQKCPEKYRFMHVEIFTKYWLTKKADRVKQEFDREMMRGIIFLSTAGNFQTQLQKKYIDPLRQSIDQGLQSVVQVATDAADPDLDRPMPYKGSTKVEDAGRPYINKLKDLLALADTISSQVDDFDKELDFRSAFIPGKRMDAFNEVRGQLMERFVKDALALLDPLAARIRKGEHIEKTPWPELQTLSVDYTRAAINAENYLAAYEKAKDLSIQLGATDVFGLDDDALEKVDPTIARKFKRGDKRREPIRQSFIDNSAALADEMKKLMADILAQIQTGNPPKKGDKSLEATAIIQTRLKELKANPKQ